MDAGHLQANSVLQILKRRKRSLILFFLLTVSAVAAGSYHMTPVYRASVLLLVDVESPYVLSTVSGAELGGKGGDSYNVYSEYFNSQMDIITSTFILRPIFDYFGLVKTEEYLSEIEPFKKFLKTVIVAPVRGTRFLRISVDNKDPVLASKIANTIGDVYVRYNLFYISRNESLNLLKNEYLILKSKLSEYNKIYKHKHPELIRLKEEMSEIASDIAASKNKAFKLNRHNLEISNDLKSNPLEGLKANNVSIIDPAIVPVKPHKPNYMVNFLLACMFGLLGGGIMCFIIEIQDDAIRSQDEVEALTSWHFLVKLPHITGTKKEMHALTKSQDYISETFKSLRTRIFFMEAKGGAPKSIVLSSLGPSEGKTTIICNLAVTCAMLKKRVLLVDADLRKPRIHSVFHSKSDRGLGAFLAGKSTFDEIIQQTKIENLFIVSDTRSVRHSSEILFTDKLKDFVLQSEANFDVILYDTPPIGVLTDATVLSSLMDGLVLVLECGKTPRKALIRNCKTLKESRIKVFGFVMNRAEVLKDDAYSYYYDHAFRRGVDYT